jgi:hypothetical protein
VSLAELWRIVARRRWVIVPGLVLALLAGAAGYVSTPPVYSQNQSYLLLSPVVTDQGRGNPFLQLGNGVGMAASVLSKKVSDGETVQAITASEPGLEYTVNLDPTTSAPVLMVTTTAPDPRVVTSALDRLEEELATQLAALQKAAGAPEVSWVTISPLTSDVAPQASHSAAMRTGVLGIAAVLLLVLLLVAALEARRARRLRATPTARVAGGDGSEEPGGDPNGRVTVRLPAPAPPRTTPEAPLDCDRVPAGAGVPERAAPLPT